MEGEHVSIVLPSKGCSLCSYPCSEFASLGMHVSELRDNVSAGLRIYSRSLEVNSPFTKSLSAVTISCLVESCWFASFVGLDWLVFLS